jgi:predicted dehydrogenase
MYATGGIMSSKINVALAGTGGYAAAYLDVMLDAMPAREDVRFVAAVDPFPERCARTADMDALSIPLFPSLERLFQHMRVDLLMISTPIHLHSPQTCFALERGASVLCEKPLAGTLTDAQRMLEAQKRASGFVAIGFQWSFSQAVQSLKRDILAGELGRPIKLKSICCAPRPRSYFTRSDWAGKIRTAGGDGVLDSPVNNATSHFLHNMLYLLGDSRESSASPASVQAELYRANTIENYDTAVVRCITSQDAEILFYTTHAVSDRVGPVAHYEFEKAVVDYDSLAGGKFIATFRDGRVKNYGSPNVDRHEKIGQCIDAVKSGRHVACGIEAAMSHTLCVVASQMSARRIIDFPLELTRALPLDGQVMNAVDGLYDAMSDCYAGGILPSEQGDIPWAVPSDMIDAGSLRRDEARIARPVAPVASVMVGENKKSPVVRART